jgi:hypothetical protein
MTKAKLLALVGIAVLSSGALGQDAPLKGPEVKQDRPAGLGGQFAEGREDRKGPMTERIPMRVYAQAVDKLRGDDAPEGLRLSREQDAQIRKIEADFRSKMQEFARRNQPAGGESGQNEESRRARMQEMRRSAPDPTDVQVKVYALLSPEQKKFVEAEVAKTQAEIGKRRTEENAQRLLKRKQGEAKPGERPTEPPEGRERARRIFEKLQQLSPQERDQLLNRLEAELDRRIGQSDGARRPDPTNPKP